MLNESGKHNVNEKIPVVLSKNDLSEDLDEINFDIGLDDDIEKKPEPTPNQETIFNAELESNSKSIYVKNVDNSATPKDLEEHFKNCGLIDRITILCDKYTGVPKGYAFIEFSTLEGKERSKQLNDSFLKGRRIKIDDKRKNIPMYFAKHSQILRPHVNAGKGIRGKLSTNRNFKPY